MRDTINSRIKLKSDTTANWNSVHGTFTPLKGEVIIYTDYQTDDGENVPGIKIGTGNAYLGDLPFVDKDIRQVIMNHIQNTNVHVTAEEKEFWNDKVNIDDAYAIIHGELEDETLIFTRL